MQLDTDGPNKRVTDYRGFIIWFRDGQFYWTRGDGYGFPDLAHIRTNIDAQLAIDEILRRHHKYRRAVAKPNKSP